MKDAFWLRHDSNAQHDERILELRAEFGWEGYGLFWALVERMRDAQEYRLAMGTMGGLATSMGLLKPKMLAVVELCCTHGLFAMEEEGAYVYSPSLRRRMEEWDTKKAALAEAGKRGQAAKQARKAEATLSEELSQAEATLKPPLSHPDGFLSREDKSREEEIRVEEKPLPSVEDAASAAGEPGKKIEVAEPLPESPQTELRTPGGAADVGTRKRATFTPPTYDEMLDYMTSQRPHNRPADVERVATKCFGYYSGNGWKVGKNAMKDWKGACQTFLADLPKLAPGQPALVAPQGGYNGAIGQRPSQVSTRAAAIAGADAMFDAVAAGQDPFANKFP